MMRKVSASGWVLGAALVLLASTTTPVKAAGRVERIKLSEVGRAEIPSFSRQTQLACSVCHTSFPQLTAFGRRFKLNGYTLTGIQTVKGKPGVGGRGVRLNLIPGLSTMVQTSVTRTDKAQPGTQNNNVDFPQEMSFFYGGALGEKLGAFIQVTYAAVDGSFGFDNADLRFATHEQLASKDLILGLTLNNNPTIQDVWNTTSAWGYPFASSEVAPTPAAATVIEDALAQEVAGLGGYVLWDGLLYGEATFYRSAPQGAANPPDASSEAVTKGIAPYWRLAVEPNVGGGSLEVGTYGLYTRLYPEGVTGLTDSYTDLGFDAQYQHRIGQGALTARGTWIREDQKLNATFDAGGSANPKNTLNSYKLNGTYFLDKGVGLTLGGFAVQGEADAGLYAPDPIEGSANGKPNSTGLIAQLDFMPWENARLALQYTLYDKFNGSSSNYDGSGRNASDNNTLYFLTWLVF